MRAIAMALLGGLVLGGASALAADWKSDEGQPLCKEREELHEAILAGIQKDDEWIAQLKGCVFLKAGIKLAIIEEDEAGENAIARVIRVRAISRGTSMVGYTLRIDKPPSDPAKGKPQPR